MDEIKHYLREKGIHIRSLEGSASHEELNYLCRLAQKLQVKYIAEVGFNAGFSSYAFLAACPDATVTSFDIAEHAYTDLAKRFIDQKFPGRHNLVVGDSRKTIPKYEANAPFDLVFIDGGHTLSVASADLHNMRRLCTTSTAVVMDDLVPWLYWGVGPTLSWHGALKRGELRQAEIYQDGRKVKKLKFPAHRAWALGFYA